MSRIDDIESTASCAESTADEAWSKADSCEDRLNDLNNEGNITGSNLHEYQTELADNIDLDELTCLLEDNDRFKRLVLSIINNQMRNAA